MISFRGHHWLVRPGQTRWVAMIESATQKPEEVRWDLEIHCRAGGARWRRVQEMDRPTLELTIVCIKNANPSWTGLAELNFWTEKEELLRVGPGPGDLEWGLRDQPLLDIFYEPKEGNPREYLQMVECIWRVVRREGAGFLMELAADGNIQMLRAESEEVEVMVMADGTEEEVPKHVAADFWKENAQVYVLEEVRFGRVEVKVPRNVQDPIAYAQKRARDLLGLKGAAESAEVWDLVQPEAEFQPWLSDLNVKLNYHGFFEDL